MISPRASLIVVFVTLASALLLAGCGTQREGQNQRSGTITKFSPAFEARQCLAKLAGDNASFTPLTDVRYSHGCSTINAVQLSSIQGDTSALSISNIGATTCPLAIAFAGWLRYGVDRAARQILGSPLLRVETMGSFACRDIAGTHRMSAHATANAIDVSAFDLVNGQRISILQDWYSGSPSERDFLRVIHHSACSRFTMVLGPDYNQAHSNHFHLEYSNHTWCR